MDINDYINQGTAFFQQGKIGPAIESFEAALKLQPGNADLRQMVEMLKMQNANSAREDQASVNEAKHRAEILGIAVTDVDKAIAEFTEALKRNPNDDSAKNSLASAYYIRGLTFTAKREHARAVEDYSEAIKNQPDYPLAFNKRGWANLEMGNYDQAIKDFEKVIQFNPDDAQAKKNLARAYMKRGIAYDQKGDYDHAIPDFEMVLKFEPDNNTARELLQMAKANK
jgi:tetratricopeptide (TPR) repeat protein